MRKIFLCLFIVFLLASFLSINLSKVFASSYTSFYLLQSGSYNSLSEARSDFNNIDNKLILYENNSYNVYLGVSLSLSNINLMKKKYNNGYSFYVKELYTDNKKFIKNMKSFDYMLKFSKRENMDSIISIMLSYYEENFNYLK